MEVAVTITRPGFSIRLRSRHKASVGHEHRISREEAQQFLTREFGVIII